MCFFLIISSHTPALSHHGYLFTLNLSWERNPANMDANSLRTGRRAVRQGQEEKGKKGRARSHGQWTVELQSCLNPQLFLLHRHSTGKQMPLKNTAKNFLQHFQTHSALYGQPFSHRLEERSDAYDIMGNESKSVSREDARIYIMALRQSWKYYSLCLISDDHRAAFRGSMRCVS